jgi:hypothetical protein
MQNVASKKPFANSRPGRGFQQHWLQFLSGQSMDKMADMWIVSRRFYSSMQTIAH